MNMISGFVGPSPKTVCVAFFHRSQALQSLAAERSPESVRIEDVSAARPVSVPVRIRDRMPAFLETSFIFIRLQVGSRPHKKAYLGCDPSPLGLFSGG